MRQTKSSRSTQGSMSLAKTLRLLTGFVFAMSVAACGGGSSSGGGGGGSPAGTYNGMATATLSSPGLPTMTLSGSIQFVIDAQGKVISDPNSGAAGMGMLNGNSFIVTVPGSFANQPGVTCAGSLQLSGTISNNTITGTFSQSGFSCNGIAINVTGSFTATRSVAASVVLPVGTNLMDSLRDAVNTTR